MYQNNQNQNQQGMNFGAQQNMGTQQNAGVQQGSQNQNNSRSNRAVVPEAKGALNQMKYEIASELGINLKQGYNGDLPSRQAGYIGGYMVNLMRPAKQVCSYFQLPPIRFSRNGLRNQFDTQVEYRVRVGVEI